ncbi:MAG: type III-B CRISPR module RAMP protein Cmr1 [Firmicutes bacterium]|nr:type III-B CRISPR module RAMP protein Cmr1 [Candidatus Fermentithermobacillaceae bacterium]
MRKIPADECGREIIPPPVTPHLGRRRVGTEQVALTTQVREYELITPLFGGGVEPGVPDPVMPVRGTEIRGQLRFWWRATRGGRFNGSLAEMKKREDEIWGTTGTDRKGFPSNVQITVRVINAGEDKEIFVSRNRAAKGWENIAYVAFPLQSQGRQLARKVRVGVSFELTLTYPERISEDVEAALWAWETFGGVGARTRRGFGALKLVAVDRCPVKLPDPRDVENWIRQKLAEHLDCTEPKASGTLKWPSGVPHLSSTPRMRITGAKPSAWEAWEHLISRLREFRQSRGGRSGRGRSDWPEASAIRAVTSGAPPKSTPAVIKVPRAAFGLPIVFHFRGQNLQDVILRGRNYERLASPLILRPLACDGDRGVGVAIVLDGTGLPPGDLVLDKLPYVPVEALLTPEEAKMIRPLRGKKDILDAFLETL